MNQISDATVAPLLGVFISLLHFSCLQAQDIQAQCDVNQKCSCCSRNDTCLSGILYYDNDGFCHWPCPVVDCTNDCSNGFCLIPCKDGYWGGRCVNRCPDDCISCSQYYGKTNKCFKCVVGKYGKNCANSCPDNCSKTLCEKNIGSCLNCNPGYYGKDCSKLCPKNCMTCDMLSGICNNCTVGYYGNTCGTECPSYCATKFCLQENGSCNDGCKQNFEGTFCDKCRPGKYGEQCSKPCSPGCKFGVCERKHGNCIFGCIDNFSDSQYCCSNNTYCVACATVSLCQSCRNSTYGSQCQMKCPEMCNGTCELLTGKCSSCFVGFYGEECDIRCNEFCRHGVCDMEDGKCTFGCINNSTAKGCLKEKAIPTEGFPTASVVGVVVSTLAVLLLVVLILVLRQRTNAGQMAASTYDNLQGNLRNIDSTYSDLASRHTDDTGEHVYMNDSVCDA